jgi:hypothetical protein
VILETPFARRASLDAPEFLPKERRRQVTLGRLEDEVSGVPDNVGMTTGADLTDGLSPAVAGGAASVELERNSDRLIRFYPS